MKKQTPKEKVNRFMQSIKERQPVVFCVRCGSTRLDQNFITELRCYECGNTMKWDGLRFSIARNMSPRDVINSLSKE